VPDVALVALARGATRWPNARLARVASRWVGFLCKYSAAYQILCWAIFFALWQQRGFTRENPALARAPDFWGLHLPVILELQHGWITIRHVAGNAVCRTAWKPTLHYFWDFLYTEALLLSNFLPRRDLRDDRLLEKRKERPCGFFLSA